MKKLLLILLCLPMIGFGQGWETTFGGTDADIGRSVQQTTDGGYIICGLILSFGNGDAYINLIKTDSNGDSLWTKKFWAGLYPGGAGCSAQQTNDGGYVIAGYTRNSGNGDADVYLIKTDGNGDSLWTKTFGGSNSDWAESVKQTTDGGYIITGFSALDTVPYDMYLIKTDDNGDSLWTKTFGGTEYDAGYSVQQTTDGGYIICGITRSFGNGDLDVYLIKTDGNGNSIWAKTFGGSGNDEGFSVQQTTDGGYVIVGYTRNFGNGDEDVYLIKTDENGDSLWTKTFGDTGEDIGFSIQQTTDGGYIICGLTKSSGDTLGDLYLIKTDENGYSLWTKTFGDTGEDIGFSVQETTDGGYIICGVTLSFGTLSYDVYLIKTDGNGNLTSIFNIPTPNYSKKLEKITDLLGRETKGTKNEVLFYIYDDGTVEKRIIIE